MGILSTIAGGIAGMFVKKIVSADDSGQETVETKARPFPIATAMVIVFVLFHYYFIWPLLHFFFPQVNFPPIDIGVLSVLGGLF